MEIFIDNRSGIPIYTQIYNQIKDQIVSGSLPEDEPLPSIRSLARDLRISVITTKRAYEELEREGYLYTVAGKGSFAAGRNSDLIREDNLRKIESGMEQIRTLAAACSLSKEEILEMWNTIWEDNTI